MLVFPVLDHGKNSWQYRYFLSHRLPLCYLHALGRVLDTAFVSFPCKLGTLCYQLNLPAAMQWLVCGTTLLFALRKAICFTSVRVIQVHFIPKMNSRWKRLYPSKAEDFLLNWRQKRKCKYQYTWYQSPVLAVI